MKIENNKPVQIQNFNGNDDKKNFENIFQCCAYHNPKDGSLVIKSNSKLASDSKREYYINKNGSGVLITDWGRQKFKKGTFDAVYNFAQEITDKKGFMISYEDSLLLLEKAGQANANCEI